MPILPTVATAIDRFSTPFTLRRAPIGDYVDGRWVEALAPTETVIRGSLQAQTGDRLADLPEGMSVSEVRIFFTRVSLFAADETTKRRPDEIEDAAGAVWRVITVHDRKVEGGFTRAVVGMIRERGRTL